MQHHTPLSSSPTAPSAPSSFLFPSSPSQSPFQYASRFLSNATNAPANSTASNGPPPSAPPRGMPNSPSTSVSSQNQVPTNPNHVHQSSTQNSNKQTTSPTTSNPPVPALPPSESIPNFVSQYYKTSTFSFLSQNKALLQKKSADRVKDKLSGPKSDESSTQNQSSDDLDAPSWFFEEGESPPSSQKPSQSKFCAAGSVSKGEKIILHVDMDCFYVSVTLRDKPHLHNSPVAVTPAGREGGTSEISSCNYIARKRGLKSRMLVKDARVLCPELVVLTCEFDKYKKVSEQIYDIFFSFTNLVQVVSVDEALLDVTECGDGEAVSLQIRKRIFEETGCTASIGIANNVMLARLGTKKVKPDGQFLVTAEKLDSLLEETPVRELPGVGSTISEKLGSAYNIQNVLELRQLSQDALQREFGKKKGECLYNFARGIDPTPLKTDHERKSLGTQISWGVRFADNQQAQKLIADMGIEVSKRMNELDVKAKRVTLRVKKHKAGGHESTKFMNPGEVDIVSKSSALPTITDDSKVIGEQAYSIFLKMNIDPTAVRGVGLQVDLYNKEKDQSTQGNTQSVTSFFKPATNTSPNNSNSNTNSTSNTTNTNSNHINNTTTTNNSTSRTANFNNSTNNNNTTKSTNTNSTNKRTATTTKQQTDPKKPKMKQTTLFGK